MRIALDIRTIQDHFPGIARHTYDLALALAMVAPQDELLLLHDPSQRNTRYDLQLLSSSANVRLVPVSAPAFALSAQVRIPALLRAVRADVYHSPYYIMPYFTPCRSAVTIHDLIPLLYPHYFTPTQRLIFRVSVRMALRSASRALTDSQTTAEDLARLLQVPRAKVAVAGAAAGAEMQPPAPDEVMRVRSCWHLPEAFVLYVGSNKPHKNLTRLVEAHASIPNAVRVPLVVAGHWDASHPESKQRAEELGLTDVYWLGPIPTADLPALYGAARLFAFPSEYEGFGLPVLEAMACGAPVVCSRASAVVEVAGDAALLFEPTDVAAMAAALERGLSDAALRDQLRARGLERARAFSWQEVARHTYGVYVQLASPHPRERQT